MSFEDDLAINKYRLDIGCEKQPTLYLSYAERQAELKAKKDAVDEKLDLVLAEEEMSIREAPPSGVKITEGTIKALLAQNLRVLKYKEELRKVKKELYHIDAVVKAFEHRKSELSNLVSLYISGYYSQPSENRKTVNDKASKEVRNNLNKKGVKDEKK